MHATAVAIGRRGLLIRGASGSGKSALALALVAARGAVLVGDDRVLLRRGDAGAITARPHPRIAGFVERRGLGLVAVPWRGRVRLAGCVVLGAAAGEAEPWLAALPTLRLDPPGAGAAPRVLDWWDGLADGPGGGPPGMAARTQVA